jgi:ParB-like nuclease domain
VKIHPAADIFPMMSDEELQSLAADIEANGLTYPIVTDAEGETIIDGRNRFAACKLAKIKPTFVKLNGQDPLAYIVSANLQRRNLTKSQQAMAYVFVYPEGGTGGRGKNRPVTGQFSKQLISDARRIFRYSRPTAEAVLSGTTPLYEALETARQWEVQTSSKEARLARLREYAPDLFARVEDEKDKLTLDEGQALMREREKRDREVLEAGKNRVERLSDVFISVVCISQAMAAGSGPLLTEKFMDQFEEAYKMLKKLYKEQKA